jgi:hypothetical protein
VGAGIFVAGHRRIVVVRGWWILCGSHGGHRDIV